MNEVDLAGKIDELISDQLRAHEVKVTPFPQTVMRIQNLVSTPDFGIRDVVDVIRTDQTLSASVLRRANAAQFGSGVVVKDLTTAVSRIGAQEIIRLALATRLGEAVCNRSPLRSLRLRVWRDALLSAHICEILAELRSLPPEEAFLCGLLHDFGKVFGIASIEQHFLDAKIPKLTASFWMGMVERYHIDLGLQMARKWELPDSYLQAIEGHHVRSSKNKNPLLDVTFVSDRVVATLHEASSFDVDHLLPYLLNQEERKRLHAALEHIPGLVSGLTVCESKQGGADLSWVDTRDVQPLGDSCDVEIPASLLGDKPDAEEPQAIDCELKCIGKRWLAFECSVPLTTNTLAHVRVSAAQPPFAIWANIKRTTSLGDKSYFIEAVPFALVGDAKTRWNAFIERSFAATAETTTAEASNERGDGNDEPAAEGENAADEPLDEQAPKPHESAPAPTPKSSTPAQAPKSNAKTVLLLAVVAFAVVAIVVAIALR
jgi:putative nucleotidyltransferase with HDIG domain